jgi:hypothetical protein
MKLPNWFKIAWWVLLSIVLSTFLYRRYPDMIVGRAAAADIVVFVIWVALLLAPIFSEVSLLGISLKQEIQEFKGAMAAQLADVRSEIRNAIDVRTTISPQIVFPPTPPDSHLPGLQMQIKAALSEALASHGIPGVEPEPVISVPRDIEYLFAARFQIENELRRIAGFESESSRSKRAAPVFSLLALLSNKEVVEAGLAQSIREIYAVCSAAMHGEEITQAKLSFVKEVAPALIATLRAIGGDKSSAQSTTER